VNGAGEIVLGAFAWSLIYSPFTLLQVSKVTVRRTDGIWQALSLYPCALKIFPDLVRIDELPDGIPIGRQISVANIDTPAIVPEQNVGVA
jgi:hypothetical protein